MVHQSLEFAQIAFDPTRGVFAVNGFDAGSENSFFGGSGFSRSLKQRVVRFAALIDDGMPLLCQQVTYGLSLQGIHITDETIVLIKIYGFHENALTENDPAERSFGFIRAA